MATKKLSDGVGKKIVEALKKQSEIEINPIPSEESSVDTELNEFIAEENFGESFDLEENSESSLDNFVTESSIDEFQGFDSISDPQAEQPFSVEEPQFKASGQQFGGFQQPSAAPIQDSFASDLDDFEIPSNIAVLKKLITHLPKGVSRHTGAQIIRQTMEALGISMKSVLQEAQQVQESLNSSAKECYSTIQEYKKQIIALEKQAQNHQRQYSALNELISLFIQTGR